MEKRILFVLMAVLYLPWAMGVKVYDRCDDICRVLGYDSGECRFVDTIEKCFCLEELDDAAWILPNACEKSAAD